MDIVQGERTEVELTAFIERRTRKGEADPDERDELWKASAATYTARRREEMRAARVDYHRGQAVRLRTVLEELIDRHEEQAERYRNQPKGAA